MISLNLLLFFVSFPASPYSFSSRPSLTSASGLSISQGEWKFGKKSGLGRYRTRSGMEIMGHYENDLLNGVARMVLPTGEVVGEHKNDNIHGLAVSVDVSGSWYAGMYDNGRTS